MKFCLVLLCFSIVHCASLGQEPQCSKFHYEEQLLEKMIRMEIKVEDIEKRILQTNQNVLEVLEDLKTERQNTKNEFVDMQLQNKREMEERITALSKLKETMATETITFKAQGPVDLSLNSGQTIVFADTLFNYGEGYNNVTGIFVSPVGGTYLFTIQFCTGNGKAMHFGIMMNDVVQTAGTFYDTDATKCHSADAILVLKGGERVKAVCQSCSSGNVLYKARYYWNTFSGVLIHR